jgi:hypothetical protein
MTVGQGLPAVRRTSHFSALPIHLEAGRVATSALIVLGPWQPPPVRGLVGHRQDNPAEQVLMLTSETPIELLPLLAPVTKPILERMHLDKFCTDWHMARGERPYTRVQPGPAESERPDFIAGRRSELAHGGTSRA